MPVKRYEFAKFNINSYSIVAESFAHDKFMKIYERS